MANTDQSSSSDNDLKSESKNSRRRIISDLVKTIAEATGNAIKVGSIVSFASGLITLIAFLRTVGAPLPPIDTSFLAFLALLTVIYTFSLFMIVTAVCTLPVAHRIVRLQPYSFVLRTMEAEYDSGSNRYKHQLLPYLLLFCPYLSVIVIISIWSFFDIAPSWVALTALLVMSLLAAGAMKVIYRNNATHFDLALPWLLNLFAICWIGSVYQLLSAFVTLPATNHWFDVAIGLASLVAIVLLHYVLNTGKITFATFGYFYLFLWFSCLLFYPSWIGGITLRVLGIGGGIPVSLAFDKDVRAANGKTTRYVAGCLILAIGDQIWLEHVGRPEDCHLSRLLNSRRLKQTDNRDVVGYARSNVLTIRDWFEDTGQIKHVAELSTLYQNSHPSLRLRLWLSSLVLLPYRACPQGQCADSRANVEAQPTRARRQDDCSTRQGSPVTLCDFHI